jgi:SprT protein
MVMDKRELFSQKLSKYLPEKGLKHVVDLIFEHRVRFKISQVRKTKFGDYRYNPEDDSEQISVNGNLNPYSFYFTTIHEFAHLIAFKTYGRRIAPHGEEWKHTFSILLMKGEVLHWFPIDIRPRIKSYMNNPKASTASDHDLFIALRKYDQHQNPSDKPLYLHELKRGQVFALNKRQFVLGEKRRTRYVCKEFHSGRDFLVSGLAEVEIIE